MSKFPKLNNFNEMFTPDSALDLISQFLPKDYSYWEACYGQGHMAEGLRNRGYTVVGNKSIDCLNEEPDEKWDIFITNPPFNGNKKFVKRAIDLGKPFVFLMRLEHLGGVKAAELFGGLDFSILIPKKRINYITPKIMLGEKTGGSLFHSVWVVRGIDIGGRIVYEK